MKKTILYFLLGLSFGTAILFQNCMGFKALDSNEKILSSAVATGVTAVTCNANYAPQRTPLRLISNSEYDNIAGDIFLSRNPPSAVAKFDKLGSGNTGFTNTSVTSEPSTPIISDLMVEKYWNAAGAVADEVVGNKANVYPVIAACAVGMTNIADSCYDNIVRSLGLRVWRRPISESGVNNEFARLKAILKSGASFDVGFRDFIKTLLISPNFLVVSFQSGSPLAAGESFDLNEFQMASRLSFFIWQSAPDEQLLKLAASGRLSEVSNLKAQVQRMIADSKGKRFAAVMTKEWIEAKQILDIGLTSIDSATLNAMVTETQMMFEDIIAKDLSFLNAISADYSFLNKSLADYYGVPFSGANPAQFYNTSLASTQRRGVLNQAAFLIATSGSPTDTHPVNRGKIISKKISCFVVPPPPVDVDTSVPADIPPNSTPAEFLAIHRQKTQCAACHTYLDPYGLPMESFDSFGNWRTTYSKLGGRTIDTSGSLPTGERFSDTKGFMENLVNSKSVRTCLVKNVMSLGLARAVASGDENCNTKQIADVSMTETSKFSDLIINIVTSRQFRMQTVEAP